MDTIIIWLDTQPQASDDECEGLDCRARGVGVVVRDR